MKFLTVLFFAIATASAAVSDRNGRIVNGQIATDGEFPYQVALQTTGGALICGGTLISSTAVLSAAHCAQAGELIFGTADRVNTGANVQRRTIALSAWTQHPNYNAGTLANDIAVIRFAAALTLNNFVNFADLATGTDLFVGDVARVSGYGQFTAGGGGAASEVIRFIAKTVITNAVCQGTFGSIITADIICASGNLSINQSVCGGDSGGPLTVQRNGRSMVIGIVKFGAAGCNANTPDAYARVTSYTPWIQQQMA